MTCVNYKFLYKDENQKNRLVMELISNSTPSQLDSSQFDYSTMVGYPQNYLNNTLAAAGSYIYVVANGDLYMADDTGVFKKQ